MNRTILIGNLTHDPQLRTTTTGVTTCSFSIAVNRPRAKDGTQGVDFIPIVTWRNIAESCAKYLTKGKKVCVDGHWQNRSYESKKDGAKRYISECIAESVEFLSPVTAKENGATMPDSPGSDTGGFTQVDDDDLPY